MNHTAQFFNPEAAWQSMESLATDSGADLLLEQHVKQYGEAGLYLGLVANTREQAIWFKIPDQFYEQSETNFPDSLWVKTIVYLGYSLLIVVLTDPAAAIFTEFTLDLLDTIGSLPAIPVTKTLLALLHRWQSQLTKPMRYAA